MACLLKHDWSWPRKRGNRDVQVCSRCGFERTSKVQFDGPRYRKTQEGIDADRSALLMRRAPRVAEVTLLSSVA